MIVGVYIELFARLVGKFLPPKFDAGIFGATLREFGQGSILAWLGTFAVTIYLVGGVRKRIIWKIGKAHRLKEIRPRPSLSRTNTTIK